jgi:metal-responsive CopG/Arc/MetJ family transcriptional regulator
MANVKTAISLQQSLFDRVDALARELTISRSRLFTMAVEEFIQRHENQKLLEALNAAYDDSPDSEEQVLLHEMRSKQRQIVQEDQW